MRILLSSNCVSFEFSLTLGSVWWLALWGTDLLSRWNLGRDSK